MQRVYKVVMVGDFGVGKTSLVQRFVNNSFSEEYLSTIGVSISKKILHQSTIMLWDIEGHTEFKPIFKQYLLGAKGFIVVGDLTRQNTIESIANHIKLSHEVVPDAPIAVALNKADIQDSISKESIEDIKNLSTAIVAVVKTSAKEGSGVETLFEALNKAIVDGNA
jgi:small GTP-binding protein